MSRPEFEDGIYNYCDYICEKCTYTNKCYLYWSERHPEEAEEDLKKATEKWDEFFEDVAEDPGWEEAVENMDRFERDEEEVEKIMEPAKEIIDIAHPMLKELFPLYDHADDILKEAIDHISINHILISAKYYRAIHDLPETPDEDIDELVYWGLEDSEKTFMAMKGFLWNLKNGCNALLEELPQYKERCVKIKGLANVILDRIENEHLPLVNVLINGNRDKFDIDND